MTAGAVLIHVCRKNGDGRVTTHNINKSVRQKLEKLQIQKPVNPQLMRKVHNSFFQCLFYELLLWKCFAVFAHSHFWCFLLKYFLVFNTFCVFFVPRHFLEKYIMFLWPLRLSFIKYSFQNLQ